MVEYLRQHIDHLNSVLEGMMALAVEMIRRAFNHDDSKMSDEELQAFVDSFGAQHSTSFGSDAYQDSLRSLGQALAHHYRNNRHHPEHFDGGVNDMNLVDVAEMVCDWVAATKRHDDGDIHASIEYNRGRFGMSDQLVKIIQNTVRDFGLDGKADSDAEAQGKAIHD